MEPNPPKHRAPRVAAAGVMLACALLAHRRGWLAVDRQRDFALPAWHAAVWFGLATAGFVLAAVATAALPTSSRRRRAALAGAGVILMGGFASGGLAVASARDNACDRFRPDPDRWRAVSDDAGRGGDATDLERVAEAIVDCSYLDGRSRDDVARVMGSAGSGGDVGTNTWTYDAGWSTDYLATGDGRQLVVTFGGDGRVARTTLNGGAAD